MKPYRTVSLGIACLALGLSAMTAYGETGTATSTGFTVTHRFETAASPAKVFAAMHEIGRWWNSAHTWSGNAQNLSITPGAGGCFCERWATGSVKHGEVIHSIQDSVLRLRAELGPLQERAVNGVLTFALKPSEGRTAVLVTYRVAGNPEAELASLAAPVDRVIGEQAARLARYVDSGRPD